MLISMRYALLFMIAIAFVTPQVPLLNSVIGVEEAHAQKKKRKSLFDVLFKRRNKTRDNNRTTRRTQPAEGLPGVNLLVPNSTRKKRNTAPAPAKPAVVVVKNENAAKILVVGDFMATGLASGLEKLYADNANFVVEKITNPSSGIVRDDVVDWRAKLPSYIEEVKPIAVLAMLGMNDRQQMRLQSGRVDHKVWLGLFDSVWALAASGVCQFWHEH